VHVRVFDARTNQPLEGVTFSFTCGLYATCDAGQSANDSNNVYAELDAEVPQCVGGLLKAEKDGYNTVTVPVSTRRGQEQRLPDLMLDPFVTTTVNFIKYQLRTNATTGMLEIATNGSIDPNKETVFVTFVRHSQSAWESPVTATALLSNDSNISSVSLIPGQYEVQAMYLDNNGFVIKKGCERVSGHDVPTNDTLIQPAPWGGLDLSNETFYWLAERSPLYAATTLTIPVFVAPPPKCIDDLQSMGETKEYARHFPTQATPQLK
jgi:hypothetical protein